MDKLKSIFISAFIMLLCTVSFYGIYVIIKTGLDVIWIGALITSLPFLLFLMKMMLLNNTPRTNANLPLISLIIYLGAMVTLVAFILGGSVSLLHQNTVGLFAAILCTVFYTLYLIWYSHLDRSSSPELKIGNELPLFQLTDTNNKQISSSEFGDKKTILLFYRGNWCPLCMAQIKEVAKSYQSLEKMGAQVLLISPQPASHTASLAKQFDVAMQFYVDTDNQAAKTLGIFAPNGTPKGFELLGYDKDTVLPTVLITDENNILLYTDLTDNYRVRPHPDDFIKVLSR